MKQITDAQHLDILDSVQNAKDYAAVATHIVSACELPAVATLAMQGVERALGRITHILEIDDDYS
jgi:hypothetical protein